MFAKRLKLIASLVLLLFLVACGGSDSDDGGVFGSGGTGSGSETGSESAGPGDATDEDVAERKLAIGSGEGDNFQEAIITASTTNLSAGGSAQLSFNIIDRDNNNALMSGESQAVAVTSECLLSGDATLDPGTISTSDGSVNFTYNAGSCSGSDSVTATLANGGTATVNLSVASSTAATIVASVPDPLSIAPEGLAGVNRDSTSQIIFTVQDVNDLGIKGKTVSFQLYPDPKDAGAPTVTSSGTTNNDGEVVAVVKAGSDNRIVRVTATLTEDGREISTTSQPVAINTTLPTQAGFTIALDNFAPNAYKYAGVAVGVTVYANDVNGVQVRDGLVRFTTTGGAIEGDCTLGATGECTVEWRSQNPVPHHGYAEIEATTVGTTCASEPCVEIPVEISVGTGLLMASDDVSDDHVKLSKEDDKYCAVASGATLPGSEKRTALPAGTSFAFTMDSTGTGEITGKTDFEVSAKFPDDLTSTTFCVDVTGSGTLSVEVTPPGNGESATDSITI